MEVIREHSNENGFYNSKVGVSLLFNAFKGEFHITCNFPYNVEKKPLFWVNEIIYLD